jgi:uncharacterized membrane protein YbhN (UPF0104 family)
MSRADPLPSACPPSDGISAPPARRQRLHSPRLLLRAAVVLLVLVGTLVMGQRLLELHAFLTTLARFDRSYLAPMALLVLVYYLLKALRWHYYLRVAGLAVPLGRSLAAYMAGQWFLFAPAGELMRAYLLGKSAPFAVAAPTVVVQALADFLALSVVATAATVVYPALAPVVLPFTLPILAGGVVLAAPPLWRRIAAWKPLAGLWHGRGRLMVEESQHLLGPGPTATGLLLGVPAVLVGGLALYLAGRAVELTDWGLAQAEGVHALMLLLGGLSGAPHGLGVAEGSGTLLLAYLGVDAAVALAALVVLRAVLLGVSAALALAGLVRLRLS